MQANWKQIATICATIVVTVWAGILFLDQVVASRMNRQDQRLIFAREQIVEHQKEIGQLRAEIVAVKCRIDTDLCGPGN